MYGCTFQSSYFSHVNGRSSRLEFLFAECLLLALSDIDHRINNARFFRQHAIVFMFLNNRLRDAFLQLLKKSFNRTATVISVENQLDKQLLRRAAVIITTPL